MLSCLLTLVTCPETAGNLVVCNIALAGVTAIVVAFTTMMLNDACKGAEPDSALYNTTACYKSPVIDQLPLRRCYNNVAIEPPPCPAELFGEHSDGRCGMDATAGTNRKGVADDSLMPLCEMDCAIFSQLDYQHYS